VLGSGSAWPIPRLGCECEQCTSSDPRDRRLRPSLLIDGRVLVDAGPDVYHQLQAAGGPVPEAVLLTHAHHDHSLGIHDMAKAGRPWLHCTKEAEAEVRRIFTQLNLRVIHLTPGVRIDLGDGLEAQAFDVQHDPRFRTMGFRIAQGGSSLVYAPDVGAAPDSKLARDADVLVIDGTSYDRPLSGHLSMVEGVENAKRLRARRTLFTHIGHRAGLQADLDAKLPEGFSVAYDGLELTVPEGSGTSGTGARGS